MGGASITKRILSYIEENLEKDLTLEKLADSLNYSKFYMARVFKEDTGITLCKYVQCRRLEKAARKLAETKQPIVQIALETGYGSQQAFTRVFHREYRCTPQEYRRIGRFVPRHDRIFMGAGRQLAAIPFSYGGGRNAA